MLLSMLLNVYGIDVILGVSEYSIDSLILEINYLVAFVRVKFEFKF
jgi:hypothetical protein